MTNEPTSTASQRVYIDMCKAWVPRAVAERMVPLILAAVDAGASPRTASAKIDARLRDEFGPDWTGGAAAIERGVRKVRAASRANRAARRLAPALIRLMPGRLRPWLARVHRPLARRFAATKYRRRYSGRFVSKLHEDDDLLHYSLDVARPEPALRYYRAAQMYFEGGAWNTSEVEKVLGEAGVRLVQARSFLEFACGYGRLTRHFVHMLAPSRITVSDIDARAVDFVCDELGVRGFYSAPSAEQLAHNGRYDVIVVVSLFSHLGPQHWGAWLRRLYEMLNPAGLLLFSTLGMHAWEVNVSEVDGQAFETKADGFLYREQNETRGRLSPDQYGVAYVSEEYVRRAVSEDFPRSLLRCCPRALNGLQDVYVLQRRA